MERRFLSWSLFACFALGLWSTIGCGPADSGASVDKAKPAASESTNRGSKEKSSTVATDEAKPESPAPKKIEPDVNDDRFHESLLSVVDEYLQYGLVNTSLEVTTPKVAPAACGPAPPPLTDDSVTPKMSEADGDVGHGQKLYFLFAKEVGHYANRGGTPSSVGQAIVKESWGAVPGNPDARNLRSHASGNRINPRIKVGDETLQIGRRKNLFVMLKTANDTPGTDEGWVYGIVNSESKEVLAAGAVASCISCHVDQDDRLFRDGIIDWDERAKTLAPDGK
jgi:hypothetical protein